MGLFKKDEMPESHFTTPRFPVHPLIDVITGEWVMGHKGDMIMNAGLCPHMAVTGKGNSNKTLIMLSIIMTFLIRNRFVTFDIDSQIYETENTLEYMRCIQIARGMAMYAGYSEEDINEIVLWISEHFVLRNSSKLSANGFYDEMNELCEERIKKGKDKILLPFNDFKGQPIYIYAPHACGVDSFSAFEPDAIAANYLDKNTAGSSDNNMMFARDGLIKTQILQKWLNQNPRSSVYMISSAHMGDNTMNLDSRAPAEKKMMFMKQNHKLKGVPEKYYFYVSCMFFVNGSTSLVNQDKVPLYPEDSTDKGKLDSKDILLELIVLRNKHGQSGAFIPLIANQNTGIDWHLSAFHYSKENGRWGVDGNNINYVLDLLPDVKLDRNVIKRKLRTDARLRRAVDINCEMQLMYRYQFDKVPKHLRCTPKELYDGIKELGYDWEMILSSTRGHYTLDHYDNPVKPLSTYDLLRMRAGEYIPYWMKEEDIPQNAKALRDKPKVENAA